MCGVFDGHGLDGAAIASWVRDGIAAGFEDALLAELKWLAHLDIDAEGSSLKDAVTNAYLKAFSQVERRSHSRPQLDTSCSGTTVVTVLKLVRGFGTVVLHAEAASNDEMKGVLERERASNRLFICPPESSNLQAHNRRCEPTGT